MTSADDALFEPLSGPVIHRAASGIVASGISKRPEATAIDILTANPKQIYIDAANEVIDHAVKCHPQMLDARIPNIRMPSRAIRLDHLVDRFHSGDPEFWVSCPGLTPPTRFAFAGRFGHGKVWRFAQQVLNSKIAQFVADWFWIDSQAGQLSAVEIGIILLHPNIHLHHVFSNQSDAQNYFIT